MNEEFQCLISQRLADHALINEAIGRAVREAVLKLARAGQPVATWQNGQVAWIQADEILSRFANEPTT